MSDGSNGTWMIVTLGRAGAFRPPLSAARLAGACSADVLLADVRLAAVGPAPVVLDPADVGGPPAGGLGATLAREVGAAGLPAGRMTPVEAAGFEAAARIG
jgi:hypothetical protein